MPASRRLNAVHHLVLGTGLTCTAMLLSQGVVKAASQSQAQITILPTVCVIDVVQDGSGQNLQTTTSDCNVLLPNLVVPVPATTEASPLSLPFAGSDISRQLVSQPQVMRTGWSPIVTTEGNGSATRHSLRAASVMAAGIASIVIVTAIGMDVVLFELRYSKLASHWMRQRLRRG